MNRNDVIDVLSVVAAATRRSVGESDVAIWEPVIGSLPKDLALQAVRDHIRDSPGVWLEPGHVYQRARAIHRDYLDRETAPSIQAKREQEHFPGDAKSAPDAAPYPPEWTTEQRLTTYWYALRFHAVPHTTAGWRALLEQRESEKPHV
jgi:hypothetical protein